MADKPNVTVMLGQGSGLKYSEPDALALRVGTAALGAGFTGRLMANVRDKEGLTYGIGAGLADDAFSDGAWQITANFAPDLLEKGMASTKRQLDGWYSEGVTAAELERVKSYLIGTFKVGLATTDGLSNTLLNAIHRGLRRDLAGRISEAHRGALAPGSERRDQEASASRQDDVDQGGRRAATDNAQLAVARPTISGASCGGVPPQRASAPPARIIAQVDGSGTGATTALNALSRFSFGDGLDQA